MRKKTVAFSILLALVIAGGIIVPAIFGNGCDPNVTCLPGEMPLPVECTSGGCDNAAQTGYCIICVYIHLPI
jgi:hypothetical protein